MLQKIRVRSLRAIEEVFLLALFAFGGAGVGVRVGDFGGSTVATDHEGVVRCHYGGEGRAREDVAGRAETLVCGRRMVMEERFRWVKGVDWGLGMGAVPVVLGDGDGEGHFECGDEVMFKVQMRGCESVCRCLLAKIGSSEAFM